MLEQSDVKDDNAQNINRKIKRAAAAQMQHCNVLNTLTLTSARAGDCVYVFISLCQSCCCCCCAVAAAALFGFCTSAAVLMRL